MLSQEVLTVHGKGTAGRHRNFGGRVVRFAAILGLIIRRVDQDRNFGRHRLVRRFGGCVELWSGTRNWFHFLFTFFIRFMMIAMSCVE